MKLINWINKVTKLNQSTMIEFQNNIESGKQDKMVEGTWIPSINTVENKAPTITYTTQVGKYERIGKLVFVDFYVRGKITKLNGTENYAVIEGLPFRPRDKYFGQQSLNVALVYSLLEDNLNVAFIPQDRKIRIQALESSAKKLKITNTNYFEIAGSGWYETDD
jgi:hypothetical protein